MERAQKEYYLNEKLKAIQKELGRGEASEIEQLKKKIETSGMPEGPMEKAMQELKRLKMMPPMSAESTVSRNYLDWLLAVPWKKRSRKFATSSAREEILSEDHYGLEKIKERILEYLAVRQLVKNPKGSILCFLGPPALARRLSRCRSAALPAENLSAYRLAACVTKPKFEAIAAPTSARCPARSFR